MRIEPQNMVVAFDVLTSIRLCLSQICGKNVGQLLNCSQIPLVVTCTADSTLHHQTNSAKKFKFPRELRNSKQNKFGNLPMVYVAGFGNFKTFFVL